MAVERAEPLWSEVTRDGCYRPGCCFAVGAQPYAWEESASVFIRLKVREDIRPAAIDLLASCGARFEQFDVQQLIAFAEANGWEPRGDVAPAVREIAPYFGVSTEGSEPAE